MPTVLHRHLRELGYCNRGCRAFFARHGLDWPRFLREGIQADKLEATEDAMALRAVDHARAEHGRQQ
jgi:hypothetical protein